MDNLLQVAEARQRLLSHFSTLEGQEVPLDQAVGCVLAKPVVAPFDLPPFPNSSMDGFAVRSPDVSGAAAGASVRLRVIEDIPAGSVPERAIGPGEAARIMTGAPVPEGADAVVPVEDTDVAVRQAGTEAPSEVQILRPVRPGDSVRGRGQDVRAGEEVLPAGRRLRPQEAGFLAMLGIDRAYVIRRPRVAIFSTGDELLAPGASITPGKIFDSNSAMLAALVREAGGEANPLGIAPDQLDAVRHHLDQAASLQADLILSSAGVSVGAFDYVRAVVQEHGILNFWRVNMRPGKPLAFGSYRGIPFIGLPGNPVSAFVGFEVFVRPALIKMLGADADNRPQRQAFLGEPVESDGRESYLRAFVEEQDGRMVATLTGHQGSGNLHSLVKANALILIPAGVKYAPEGSEVLSLPFGDL